jgi:prepilin-type N-terminal cleavage/methylation domain-containing protein
MLLLNDFWLRTCRRLIATAVWPFTARFYGRSFHWGDLPRIVRTHFSKDRFLKKVPSSRPQCAAGFTLLELLIAMSIVAALCATVLGLGRRATDVGYIARAKTELAALSTALDEYQRICGDYPRTNDAARVLQSLIGRRGPRDEVTVVRSLIETARFTVGDHLDPFADSSAVLVDPWGRAYRYVYKTQSPWSNSSCVLYSIGPDGRDSPGLLAGGFIDSAPAANADNLYANQYR